MKLFLPVFGHVRLRSPNFPGVGLGPDRKPISGHFQAGAQPQEGEKRLLRSPRSMGGLTKGRVRIDKREEGSRKRVRAAATIELGSKVIQRQGKSTSNMLVKSDS